MGSFSKDPPLARGKQKRESAFICVHPWLSPFQTPRTQRTRRVLSFVILKDIIFFEPPAFAATPLRTGRQRSQRKYNASLRGAPATKQSSLFHREGHEDHEAPYPSFRGKAEESFQISLSLRSLRYAFGMTKETRRRVRCVRRVKNTGLLRSRWSLAMTALCFRCGRCGSKMKEMLQRERFRMTEGVILRVFACPSEAAQPRRRVVKNTMTMKKLQGLVALKIVSDKFLQLKRRRFWPCGA